MELQVGVKAFLKNREGKFLLLKRNPEKYPHVGNELWDIVGGRIVPGTPLIENLRREIKEETGLDLEEDPKLFAAQDILKVPGKHVVRLTYMGIIDGEPQLDADHSEFRWFTLSELKQLGDLDRFAKELITNNIIG